MSTLAMLLALLMPITALAQPPVLPSCKDTPAQCDKELLLLREEVDTKRRMLAVLWAMQEEWQARAEKAEAQLKALEPAPAPPKEP